jgi:hypothetical protein
MMFALEKFCESMLPARNHCGEPAAYGLNSRVDCPYVFVSTASLSPFEPPAKRRPRSKVITLPVNHAPFLATCWVGASDASR